MAYVKLPDQGSIVLNIHSFGGVRQGRYGQEAVFETDQGTFTPKNGGELADVCRKNVGGAVRITVSKKNGRKTYHAEKVEAPENPRDLSMARMNALRHAVGMLGEGKPVTDYLDVAEILVSWIMGKKEVEPEPEEDIPF